MSQLSQSSSPSPRTRQSTSRNRSLLNPPALPPSSTLRDAITKKDSNLMNQLSRVTLREESNPNAANSLFHRLLRERTLKDLTNLTSSEIRHLGELLEVAEQAELTKGPASHTSIVDALTFTLIYYRSGSDFATISGLLGVTESCVERAIKRVRPLLGQHAREDLVYRRTKPKQEPAEANELKDVALIVDSTTLPTYRPKGRFGDAKTLWDGKNWMYGVKKQVSIRSVPPYDAIFVHPYRNGSVHDASIYRQFEEEYRSYLSTEGVEWKWKVLGDKGYQGSSVSSKLVTPSKGKNDCLTTGQQARNQEIAKTRVWVECWFGKLKTLWKLFSSVYRNCLIHIDDDFDACAFLTNLVLSRLPLGQGDETYHIRLMSKWREEGEKKRERRRRDQETYKRRKIERVQRLGTEDQYYNLSDQEENSTDFLRTRTFGEDDTRSQHSSEDSDEDMLL